MGWGRGKNGRGDREKYPALKKKERGGIRETYGRRFISQGSRRRPSRIHEVMERTLGKVVSRTGKLARGERRIWSYPDHTTPPTSKREICSYPASGRKDVSAAGGERPGEASGKKRTLLLEGVRILQMSSRLKNQGKRNTKGRRKRDDRLGWRRRTPTASGEGRPGKKRKGARFYERQKTVSKPLNPSKRKTRKIRNKTVRCR